MPKCSAIVLEGLRSKNIPKIKKIQKDVRLCYQYGWNVVRYIESTYGQKMMLNVVKNCADGDVFDIIGEAIGNFERR